MTEYEKRIIDGKTVWVPQQQEPQPLPPKKQKPNPNAKGGPSKRISRGKGWYSK